MSNQNEEWRDIPGYEGIYQASDQGHIRRIKKDGGFRLRKPHESKKDGYCRVDLHVNKKVKNHYVHRLVAAAFLGESELHVDHINHIKSDNRLENLQYVYEQENLRKYHESVHKSVYNTDKFRVSFSENTNQWAAYLVDGENEIMLRDDYASQSVAHDACDTFTFIFRR